MAPQSLKVAIVGASGETGTSIVNGLLERGNEFTITAFTRLSSLEKPEVKNIKDKGVTVVALDFDAGQEAIIKAFTGQDVVISCVVPSAGNLEKDLASAAKAAGVKRFVPSFWASVTPPAGVLRLREFKESVLNHIKKIHLPYTVIDVGWWYQGTLPKLPSGRIDYLVKFPIEHLNGDGQIPSALTDLRDIGKYVARIIADTRTLNRYVFVYNEVLTQEQIWSELEQASGEQLTRTYKSREETEKAIELARPELDKNPNSALAFITLTIHEYNYTVWIRRDNTPDNADYLGYLNGKELYPDVSFIKYKDYVREAVEGNGQPTYVNRKFAFE